MIDGARHIDQTTLAQADPVQLKVALMGITHGNGLIVAPAGYALPIAVAPADPPTVRILPPRQPGTTGDA